MKKKKVNYMEYIELRNRIQTAGTVANLIERFIFAMNGTAEQPGLRQIGLDAMYRYRMLQRMPIGAVMGKAIAKGDFIKHCMDRKAEGVSPATTNHDIVCLSNVLNFAGSGAWPDCEDVSAVTLLAAKPFLMRHRLIGKANRRTQRPTEEQIAALLAHFEAKTPGTKIARMPSVIAFALVSARRIGEICRMTHGDVDWENKVYWVRDLKHPTKKKGNDKKFVLFPELADIIRMQPRVNPDDPKERIFPLHSRTCSANYTNAKKKLGIEDLHFHDNRGDAISRWLLKMTKDQVRKLVSGHETDRMIDTNYDRRSTEEIMAGVAHLMQPATAANPL